MLEILFNVKATFKNIETGKTTVIRKHNITCTVGKNSVASRFAGNDTGKITYMAVGTGTSSPSASDTTLQTELTRKQISIRTPSGATCAFRTFFNSSEANGTLKEIGLFGDDASATADSGTLFARASIDKEKTSSETLTLDWEATVS
jgi:hypothetical protein